MAALDALVCPCCGAPLPAPAGPRVTCEFCRATSQVGGASVDAIEPGAAYDDELAARRIRDLEALIEAQAAGRSLLDAISELGRQTLGSSGSTHALRNVVGNLALELDAEHGTTTVTDPVAMSRLAEAYLRATKDIAAHGRAELHLPFLAATPKGPVDLRRTLTPAELSHLARREPSPPRRGLLGKLFGR